MTTEYKNSREGELSLKPGEILFIFKKEADYWHAELINTKKIGQIPASVAEYVLEIIESQLIMRQNEETIMDLVNGSTGINQETSAGKKPSLNLDLDSVRVTRDKRADALVGPLSAREKGNSHIDKDKIGFDLSDKSLRYCQYYFVCLALSFFS